MNPVNHKGFHQGWHTETQTERQRDRQTHTHTHTHTHINTHTHTHTHTNTHINTHTHAHTHTHTNHCCFVCVRAAHATKTTTAWKMSHSFDPFQCSTRKILYLRYFCPVTCIPRKVMRQMTSDSDVCEVYLNMQTSFLDAALSTMSLSRPVHEDGVSFFCVLSPRRVCRVPRRWIWSRRKLRGKMGKK